MWVDFKFKVRSKQQGCQKDCQRKLFNLQNIVIANETSFELRACDCQRKLFNLQYIVIANETSFELRAWDCSVFICSLVLSLVAPHHWTIGNYFVSVCFPPAHSYWIVPCKPSFKWEEAICFHFPSPVRLQDQSTRWPIIPAPSSSAGASSCLGCVCSSRSAQNNFISSSSGSWRGCCSRGCACCHGRRGGSRARDLRTAPAAGQLERQGKIKRCVIFRCAIAPL